MKETSNTVSKSKYTIDGKNIDKMIDKHLDIINQGVVAIIGDQLEAVILCGGYGRGEGGLFVDQHGNESLYNDYDMFVLTKPLSRKRRGVYQSKLTELGKKLEEDFGIEVDFGPIKTISQMKNAEFTLFNYELKYGHIVTYGNQKILDVMPSMDGKDMPVIEAVKLLLNRAVGLILAKDRLNAGELDEFGDEFVTRNIYKAIMAIGDAAMICLGKYHYSYLKRAEIAEQLRDSEIIQSLDIYSDYVRSIEYKLKPQRNIFSFDELAGLLDIAAEKLLAMYDIAINKLTGKAGRGMNVEFATGLFIELCPICVGKNIILNLYSFGMRGCSLNWLFKYPRYRLLYCMPYFLAKDTKPDDKEVRNALCVCPQCSYDDFKNRFIELWRRYG